MVCVLMGDIDDLYKQEAEDIDSNFLDELKVSKDHNKSFERYRKNLARSREKFSKSYDKFNQLETLRLRNMKKKIAGYDKFKHLEISHFSFEFGFWERTRMRFEVMWFNFGRRVARFWAWIFPDWLIYAWCKVRDFALTTWRDFVRFIDENWTRFSEAAVKSWNFVWSWIVSGWNDFVGLLKKGMFWKKVKVEEKKEEGEKKVSADGKDVD